ncbi:MAG: hypothetical protein U0163_04400 [Gemmatimonadaceae bacterium]
MAYPLRELRCAMGGETDGGDMFGASARTIDDLTTIGRATGRGTARSNDDAFTIRFEARRWLLCRQGGRWRSPEVFRRVECRNGDIRIAPFLAPGLGYRRLRACGYIDDDVATSGSVMA